jgi:isopentenyl diphosphate isomerase/L-lactate dehydrogenase-like FMN-dependent dehydrogenase
LSDLIASPDDAINVFDFRDVARQALPPAHYGYLATGVDGDETLRANREGFGRFDLRARRLVDVSGIDTGVELLDERWETPIILAPAGSQKAFHPEGELAAARASTALGHHQILSTVTTTSVEDVNAVRDRPVWYQLYPTSSWNVTQALLRRAEGAGCPALVLTVDLPVDSNRETLKRSVRADSRDCSTCHEKAPVGDDPMSFPTGWLRRKPMFDGLDMGRVEFATPSMTWDFIGRLRDDTDMRILVKGIVRDDDARKCLEYGADGIIVSNHGGRADASGRSSIESLPEVVGAVNGRIPVLVDGGFRRGTDILKALALGADAICIGRPYLWGMAAFGQAGVEKVLEILNAELQLAMQLHGVPSLADLDRSFVVAG